MLALTKITAVSPVASNGKSLNASVIYSDVASGYLADNSVCKYVNNQLYLAKNSAFANTSLIVALVSARNVSFAAALLANAFQSAKNSSVKPAIVAFTSSAGSAPPLKL